MDLKAIREYERYGYQPLNNRRDLYEQLLDYEIPRRCRGLLMSMPSMWGYYCCHPELHYRITNNVLTIYHIDAVILAEVAPILARVRGGNIFTSPIKVDSYQLAEEGVLALQEIANRGCIIPIVQNLSLPGNVSEEALEVLQKMDKPNLIALIINCEVVLVGTRPGFVTLQGIEIKSVIQVSNIYTEYLERGIYAVVADKSSIYITPIS